MRVTYIAGYEKSAQLPRSKKIFDFELYLDEKQLDAILADTLDPASKTADLLRKTDLLVINLNSPLSHAFISLALRNGVHVLSPLLLQYSADELKELEATAMETKTLLGWIPNFQIHNVQTASPAIIDCIRSIGKQHGNQSVLTPLLADLSILLNPIKPEIRKVRVYWLPIYAINPTAIKLIIDFCDNTVVTYMVKISEAITSLKINFMSVENDNFIEIKESPSEIASIQHAINFFIQNHTMEFTVETLLKSRHIYEIAMEKIGLQQ